MATDLTGLQVRNTYNSLLKIGDNTSLTGIAKRISDGLGNDSPLFISTSQISIGVAPATGYDLTVNSGIRTGSIDVLGAATVQSLQFTGGGGTQGTMSWNTDEETVDLIQNGATLQLGQETHVHVKNQSGATINDGTPVYVTGTLGASGRLTVAPMIADGSIEAKYFLGVTTEDIPNGEDGKVTTFGKIRGLNTSAYTPGTTLYVSSTTAGFWQTTPPVSPALDLEVAIVINQHANNGTLFVRAQNGQYLGLLHDVYLNSVADNQLLVYNATNSRWENQGIASIGAINLDTVTDNGNTTTNNISVGDINAGNVTLTGYLRGAANFVIDPAAHGDETGTVQILGDLRVDGTTTTINSTTVTINDKNIVLAEGSALPGDANGAGITIDGAAASMTYNSTSDRFVFNKDIETNLVGNVTGNLTGNADTASALAASVNIEVDGAVTGNADFDGSANITITTTVNHNHDDRYYTETESDNRFVNVDGDTMTGDLDFNDDVKAKFGTGDDLTVYHNATNSFIDNATGSILIRNLADDQDIVLASDDGAGSITDYLRVDGSEGSVKLFHYGSEKLVTTATGVSVTGAFSGNLDTSSISGSTIDINGTTRINLQYNGTTQAFVDSTGFNISGGLALTGVDGISLTDEDSTTDSYFHANTDYDAGIYTVTSNARYGADYIQVDGLDSRSNTRFTISPKDIGDPDPYAYLYIGGNNSNTAPNTLVDWHTIYMNALSVRINNNEVATQSWVSTNYTLDLQDVTDNGATTTNSITVGGISSSGDVFFNSGGLTRIGNGGYDLFINGGVVFRDYADPSLTNGRIYYEDDSFNFRGGGEGEADGSASTSLKVRSGGVFHEVWHAGNDGAGSGLDADLLDGVEASGFIKVDTDNQVLGRQITLGDRTNSSNYSPNTAGLTLTEVAEVRTSSTDDPPALSWHYENQATRHILLASDGTLKVVAPTDENSGVADFAVVGRGIFGDIAVESGSSNSIRIGNGFGSGGTATIHNYLKPLYLQYNNGVASGSDATTYIGGGGTTSDLNLIGGGNIVLTGRILMNRDGLAGDAIDINHVENSDWSFVFRSSSVGNDNDSGFWVNSDGTPDMRLRSTGSTVTALIHSNGTSYINGGNLAIGATSSPSKLTVASGTPTGAQAVNGDTVIAIDSSANQYLEFRTTATNTGLMQGMLFTDNGLNAFIGYKEYTGGTAGTYGEAIHIAHRDFSASDVNNGIYFGTNTNPQNGVNNVNMFIKGNGNIGVGAIDPDKQLTFVQAADDAIQIRRYTTTQGNPAEGTGISWTWSSLTTDDETWAAIRAIMPGNGNTHLTFSTRNTSAVFGERMRIEDNGDVGIGTTNTNFSTTNRRVLEINGTSEALLSFATNGSWQYYIHALASGVFHATGGKNFTVDPGAASIGLGTTSPSNAKVHIVGTGSYVGNYGYNTLTLEDASGYPGLNWRQGNSNWLFRKSGATQELELLYSSNASAPATGTYTRWLSIGANGVFETINYLKARGVRVGRDFSIANRATVRLDSANTNSPADILFGHTAAANETSWTGVYWSISSRAASDGQKLHVYRGGGNPVGGSESILMTYDPNLRVGINNTSPVATLDVAGSFAITGGADLARINFETGGYHGIRFRDDTGTNKFKWGHAKTANEFYLYDYTKNGSVFQVNGNGNMMLLPGSSKVGVNTTNPLENFHVSGTTISGAVGTTGTINRTGITNYLCYEARSTSAGNEPSIGFHKEGVFSMYLQAANSPRGLRVLSPSNETAAGLRVEGDVVAFYSDMRLKTKIGDIQDPIGKVQALNGFYYEPNEIAQSYGYEVERRIGLSAQDVKEVVPEAVHEAPIGDGYMAVDYAKLVPVLVEAIKEQQKQIDELKARLDA